MDAPRNKTILLVEDEAIIAIAEARMIKQFGYDVIIANSGEKAVAVATGEDPVDLILIDIDLGKGINGPETAAKILAKRTLPIVFLTSHSEREMVEKVRGITRYGYIIKNSGDFVLQSSIEMAFELFDAHQKLTLSESKYSAAFRTSPDSVNINSLDGRWVEINEGFTKLTGYTAADVIGVRSTEIGFWAIPEDRETLVRGLKEKGVVENLESTFRRKDGSLRTWLMSARIIMIQNKPHILSVTKEITDRKQAEILLRESEAHFRALFENAIDGIIYISPETELVDVNDSFAKMHGYSVFEMRNMKLQDLDVEDLSHLIPERMDRVRNGEQLHFEVQHYHKDGHIINLEVSTSMVAVGQKSVIVAYHRDITENKLLETARHESEDRYRTYIDQSPEAIFIVDANGRYQDVNTTACEITGYRREELLSLSVGDLNENSDSSSGSAAFIELSKTGKLKSELSLKKRSGSTVPVSFNAVRLPDGCFLAFCNDITERKLAEESLTHERNLLRTLIDNLPESVCIYIKDTASHYVINNAAHLRSLGAACQEDVIGKTSVDFFPREQAAVFLADEQKVVRTGESLVDRQERVYDKALAEERWHSTAKVPLRDSAGKVVGLVGMSTDITERKRSEEDRRRKELQQELVLNTLPMVFYTSRAAEDLATTWMSPQVEAMAGFKAEGFLQDNMFWSKHVHPEDRDRVLTEYAAIFKKSWADCEYRWQCADGSYRWFRDHLVLARNENGEPTEAVGIWIDINERKKIEHALQQKERYQRALLDNFPFAVWLKDTESRFLSVNAGFVRTFGAHDADELIGKTDFDIAPCDMAEGYRADDRAVMESREKKNIEELILTGGVKNLFETYKAPVMDENGELLGTVGFARDITERRMVEESLKKSEQDYRQLFENATDVIIIFEPDQEIILEANVVACATYDYKHDELVGMSLKKLTKDVPAGEAQIKNTMESGSFRNFETVQINKNGREIHFQVNASLVEYRGRKAILSINRDITERKRAEKNLREIITKNPMSIQILDKDGFTLEVNNSFKSLFGSVPPPGYSIFNDLQFARQGLSEIFEKLRAGEIVRFPDICFNPHDSVSELQDIPVWTRTIGFPLSDSNEKPVKFVLMHENITERKLAEDALRISDERFRSLYENSTIGLYRTTPDGSIVLANPTLVNMLGYNSFEDLAARNLEKEGFEPSYERKQFIEQIETHGIVSGLESVWTRHDGSILHMRESARAVRDSNGKTLHYDGTVEDITDRKQAEQNLKASELKYRSLIESSSDVIFCVNEKGEYIFTNDVFASTFGKTPEYFTGRTLWDVYSKDQADYRYSAITKVFATGETVSLEVDVPLQDKTLKFLARINPIKDEAGGVILALTHSTDITGHKQSEEKIKSLLAEKELLLHEVHHRIKNNMSIVTSLLTLQAGAQKEASAALALRDASNRVRSMLVLYDQLYRSEHFGPVSAKIYLTHLIDQIVDTFPNRNIVSVDKQIDDFILDTGKLSPIGIIVNELMTNGMKHAFEGRENGLIRVSASMEGKHVNIAIEDNGVGIPASINMETSTGFGMQLVDMLTKQLEGTVRIERGNGTKFILEFGI